MLRVQNQMIFNRDRATKQSFFNFWMMEIQEKSMIKDCMDFHGLECSGEAFIALGWGGVVGGVVVHLTSR